MATELKSRHFLKRGVDLVFDRVAPTLSPKGRNGCILQPNQPPLITNDGATIARFISSRNPKVNAGVDLVREASLKTNEQVGDGTTTSVVLTKYLTENIFELLNTGAIDEITVNKKLDELKLTVSDWANSIAIKVSTTDDIEKVATVSSGSEKIGKLIAKAYSEIGDSGMVTCVAGSTMEDTISIKKGYSWDKGHLHPSLIGDPRKLETVLEGKIKVLLYQGKITSYPQNVISILRDIVQAGERLLIVADDFDGMAYAPMVATKGAIIGVKTPSFGDRTASLLKDLEAVTGATCVGDFWGVKSLNDLNSSHLGVISKATISMVETTVIGIDKDEETQARADELKEELKLAVHEYDKTTLSKRISKLQHGIAQIEIGAITEIELKEKKLRVEDALCASKAAIEKGYTVGGGLPYLWFGSDKLESLKDTPQLLTAVRKAFYAPLLTILRNCNNFNPEETLDKILSKQACVGEYYGYNALTGCIENMLDSGVIDPIKVVESVIVNSLSVVQTLATVDSIIEYRGGESNGQ